MWNLILLLMLGIQFPKESWSRLHRAPDNLLIAPCTSHKNLRYISVTCTNFDNAASLYLVIKNLKNYTIDRFVIKNSKNLDMWPTLFNKVHIRELHIEHSTVQTLYLFDSFKGLEKSLRKIVIHNSKLINLFWMDGSRFSKVEKLQIIQSSINSRNLSEVVTKGFPRHIKELTLSNLGIRQLEGNVFKRFHLLEKLDLSRNELKTWNRSLLNMPADELYDLNLEHNMLNSSCLTPNTFQQMPSLENVNLANNRFDYFKQDVFKDIWPQLENMHLTANAARCDCHLLWMKTSPPPTEFMPPNCIQPARHQNKLLTSIPAEEICPNV